jgi:hypothetical protein
MCAYMWQYSTKVPPFTTKLLSVHLFIIITPHYMFRPTGRPSSCANWQYYIRVKLLIIYSVDPLSHDIQGSNAVENTINKMHICAQVTVKQNKKPHRTNIRRHYNVQVHMLPSTFPNLSIPRVCLPFKCLLLISYFEYWSTTHSVRSLNFPMVSLFHHWCRFPFWSYSLPEREQFQFLYNTALQSENKKWQHFKNLK